MNKETAIVMFKEKSIRRTWHNEEWWFSVVDVCAALTGSNDAGAYWRKLKQRLISEQNQPVTFCHGLKLLAQDGKMRITDCANTEGILRIIQSIPSPKAEPFKRWLAKIAIRQNLTMAKRMFQIIVLCMISLISVTSYADTCPPYPTSTNGWVNQWPSISYGTWQQVDWKQIQGGVIYCYYTVSQVPYTIFIYKTGFQKPVIGDDWFYNTSAQTLECNKSISLCTFEAIADS